MPKSYNFVTIGYEGTLICDPRNFLFLETTVLNYFEIVVSVLVFVVDLLLLRFPGFWITGMIASELFLSQSKLRQFTKAL